MKQWVCANYIDENLGYKDRGKVAILCECEVIAHKVLPEHAKLIVESVNRYASYSYNEAEVTLIRNIIQEVIVETQRNRAIGAEFTAREILTQLHKQRKYEAEKLQYRCRFEDIYTL